ncbi:MAG: hypothetical protein HWE20_11515 [Gammaproteobacteria bacterium]|nr:hypothetical protein [Gammaproteobacteria bacterium]
MKNSRACIIGLLALSMSACANFGQKNYESATIVDAPIQHSLSSQDAVSHWRLGEGARDIGRYSDAMEYYLKALDVVPGDPAILSRVAEMHARLNNVQLAEQAAVQSNIGTSDVRLRYRNWLIIRHARQVEGDAVGVEKAESELRALMG